MNSSQESHIKEFTIIVNGREKKVTTKELSFDQVVALAFNPPPTGPNIVITVTFRNAEDQKSGTLTKGQTVTIKDGTIFNVTATDKS